MGHWINELSLPRKELYKMLCRPRREVIDTAFATGNVTTFLEIKIQQERKKMYIREWMQRAPKCREDGSEMCLPLSYDLVCVQDGEGTGRTGERVGMKKKDYIAEGFGRLRISRFRKDGSSHLRSRSGCNCSLPPLQKTPAYLWHHCGGVGQRFGVRPTFGFTLTHPVTSHITYSL
jgi:hypothetical protein